MNGQDAVLIKEGLVGKGFLSESVKWSIHRAEDDDVAIRGTFKDGSGHFDWWTPEAVGDFLDALTENKL